MVLGHVMVACGGSDTAEEVVEVAEEPAEELESPATTAAPTTTAGPTASIGMVYDIGGRGDLSFNDMAYACLLYTSPSPRDEKVSRMPSSA